MSEEKELEKGVLSGAQTDFFENFDGDEALANDARPFRAKAQPIGGSRKGRPNKRTNEMRDLYLKMGLPHPMLFLGQLLAMGVDGITKELECEPVQAADLLRKTAADLMPYLESKMPTKVLASTDEGLPVLVIGNLGAAAQEMRLEKTSAGLSIDDDLIEAVEKQSLSKSEARASHEDASHDDFK